MRIFLTGFMGAGKSAVGKRLAALLDLRFVDLDDEIERASGRDIPQLFAEAGEAEFRRLESEVLARVAERDGIVVATGGGTPTVAMNRECMSKSGVAFWLDPDLETLLARLADGRPGARPLYEGPRQAAALYRRRLASYRASGTRIEVAPGEDGDRTAARIRDLLGEARCAI